MRSIARRARLVPHRTVLARPLVPVLAAHGGAASAESVFAPPSRHGTGTALVRGLSGLSGGQELGRSVNVEQGGLAGLEALALGGESKPGFKKILIANR
jgi:hypothetical protein